MLIKRLTLASLSTLLLALSMPGSVMPELTWIAITPAFIALSGARAHTAALILFICALQWWLLALWEVSSALENYSGVAAWAAIPILMLLCAYQAIPYAVIAWLIAKTQWLTQRYGFFSITAIYTCLVSLFPSPVPGHHAHSLYQETSLIQVLDIGGAPLLLFFVVLCNVLFAKTILTLFQRSHSVWPYPCGIALLLIALKGYGDWRMAQTQTLLESPNKTLTIGIVQPNLRRDDNINSLIMASAKLSEASTNLDLVVWPEIPNIFSYMENPKDAKAVNDLIKFTQTPMLLVSGYVYEDSPKHQEPRYYNTAHLIDVVPSAITHYDKQILVPFFEYLPLGETIPFLRSLFPGTHTYLGGPHKEVLELGSDIKIIPLICYETIFSSYVREFFEQQGNIMINVSNDYWFGTSWVADFHFALGAFRAVEYRTPWIRVANTGISAHVNQLGEIEANTTTEKLSEDARVYQVTITKPNSIYLKFGDWFLYLLIAWLMIVLIKTFWPPKEKSGKQTLVP